MEVITAKSAGFCFGVKRAVEQVYEQIETGKKIYTYGPIIHNEEVVKDLEQRGVQVISDEQELKKVTQGTVIIRSHGVSRAIYEQLKEQKLEWVDATCPFVKRIHSIVEEESGKGKKVVIIGNSGHPEVVGIEGWSLTDTVIIDSTEAADRFTESPEKRSEKLEELCIVSQTTFNYNKFKDIVEIFSKKGYNVSVVNTICSATEERQTEAREIASQVETMIVIGGTHSSNSQKLFEICKKECGTTYFIQTLDDLHLELPKSASPVGITAGASTPNNIIEEVQNYVRINF